jgi:hypothetical protein
VDGGPGAWLVAAAAAAVAAAGVLLIDDETAQVVFLIALAVLLVGGGAVAERRRRAAGGDSGRARSLDAPLRPDWTILIPIALALAVSRLFDSDDARLAALFLLAFVFSFAWHLIRARLVRPRHP